MTVARASLVLLMLVGVGVSVVLVREETAKTANRIQGLHNHQLDLDQRLWTQEMKLAELRGPEAIRERAEQLGLTVLSPGQEKKETPIAPKPAGKKRDAPPPPKKKTPAKPRHPAG